MIKELNLLKEQTKSGPLNEKMKQLLSRQPAHADVSFTQMDSIFDRKARLLMNKHDKSHFVSVLEKKLDTLKAQYADELDRKR
jgi:hypothetical protein